MKRFVTYRRQDVADISDNSINGIGVDVGDSLKETDD